MKTNCEGLRHYPYFKYMKGVDSELKVIFDRVSEMFKKLNKTVSIVLDVIDDTEFYVFLFKSLKQKYANYQIGWLDVKDFYFGFEKCLSDNFLQIIFAFIAVSGFDTEKVIEQAYNMQITDMEHKDLEGNYQTGQWKSEDFQTSGSIEKGSVSNGNLLNTLKGFMNKPLSFNVTNILKNFEPLFFISWRIGEDYYDCCEW